MAGQMMENYMQAKLAEARQHLEALQQIVDNLDIATLYIEDRREDRLISGH